VATRGEAAGSTPQKLRGRWLREYWASTIGKKLAVAITGAILVTYVVLHVLGNLKAFQGPGGGEAAVDRYAEWLRTAGSPAIPHEGVLWTIRVILVAALIIHVIAITQLTRRNLEARPAGHRQAPQIQRTHSSRWMLTSGILLLAFVVFHILNFTTGTIDPTPIRSGEVYANLYDAFQEWYLVLIYVAASAALYLHLRHALWSATQTAGWDRPNRNPTFRRTATGLAVVVAVGFAALPVAIWADVLPQPESGQALAAHR
jgi:succinate dehydrogenase / fumarate reductase cytochrome b subunit